MIVHRREPFRRGEPKIFLRQKRRRDSERASRKKFETTRPGNFGKNVRDLYFLKDLTVVYSLVKDFFNDKVRSGRNRACPKRI